MTTIGVLNPRELPEILLKIGNYTERRHLVSCIQVCRIWYRTLLPLVWESVCVVEKTAGFHPRGPSQDCLQRHREFILKLELFCSKLELDGATFPKLRTLRISQFQWNTCTILPPYATELVALNPSLVDISVTASYEMKTSTQFWKAVSSLPHLRVLRAHYVKFDCEEMDAFWEACLNVEEVHLSLIAVPKEYAQPSNLSFIQIRTLTIDAARYLTCAQQLAFLRQCQNIENLKWLIRSDDSELDAFASDIEQGLWPKLERLEFRHGKSDAYTKRIIDGIQRITMLLMSSTQFGPSSFLSLRRHFSEIRKLDLLLCNRVESAMFQEILCSCPLLEEIKGNNILAKDIVEGGQWVCLSLKHFELCIVFDESEQNLQPLVSQRVSTLVQLTYFRINTWLHGRATVPTCNSLDLRLACGLGQLSQLKNIRTIGISHSNQSLEEADVRWMIANWKRLETIHGKLNQDPNIRGSLEAILRERGIKVH